YAGRAGGRPLHLRRPSRRDCDGFDDGFNQATTGGPHARSHGSRRSDRNWLSHSADRLRGRIRVRGLAGPGVPAVAHRPRRGLWVAAGALCTVVVIIAAIEFLPSRKASAGKQPAASQVDTPPPQPLPAQQPPPAATPPAAS